MEKETLQKLFGDYGFGDFRWTNARDIVVAQWTRFRCQFGYHIQVLKDYKEAMNRYAFLLVE